MRNVTESKVRRATSRRGIGGRNRGLGIDGWKKILASTLLSGVCLMFSVDYLGLPDPQNLSAHSIDAEGQFRNFTQGQRDIVIESSQGKTLAFSCVYSRALCDNAKSHPVAFVQPKVIELSFIFNNYFVLSAKTDGQDIVSIKDSEPRFIEAKKILLNQALFLTVVSVGFFIFTLTRR
ncbi:MAG: hypothetical protein LBU46_00930 [Candidatus Accumulibacter sp.]|nr:hypothetical protein [Accumulibacter sp.]